MLSRISRLARPSTGGLGRVLRLGFILRAVTFLGAYLLGGDKLVVGLELNQPDALGGAANRPDVFGLDADDLAAQGDNEEAVSLTHG